MNPSQPPRSLPSESAQASLARRLFLFAGVLILAGGAALAVDLAVLKVFAVHDTGPIWKEGRDQLRHLFDPGELYANGWAIILMMMVLYAADVARRRQLPRMAVIVLGTGILANVVKLLVARTRPMAFFDQEAGV